MDKTSPFMTKAIQKGKAHARNSEDFINML